MYCMALSSVCTVCAILCTYVCNRKFLKFGILGEGVVCFLDHKV